MKIKHQPLVFALVLPILALVFLAGFKAYKRYAGRELIVAITGYDPRDILSGHYLTYQLDLKGDVCEKDDKALAVCIEEKAGRFSSAQAIRYKNDDCLMILTGHCEYGRFLAGVERFYIPEKDAHRLDKVVRGWDVEKHLAEIILSVDSSGNAVVKDLLIDQMPWQEFLSRSDQ